MITSQEIEKARERISPFIWRTPLVESEILSQKSGRRIFLKLENLQKTGAFKIRGVLNKVLPLASKERISGFICATSGSHGLAVALAAELTGKKAVVVIPEVTPEIKIRRLRQKAKVKIYGQSCQESFHYAQTLAEREKLTFIPGFDDREIICGQGTVALEILEDLPDTSCLVVPIGGGGLAAGILAFVKEKYPRVKVIGVQSSGARAMYLSWKKGYICEIPRVHTIAEGIAVKKPGQLTLEIISRLIDDIVLVTESEIKRGLLSLLEEGRIFAEPAGAVSLAAVLAGKAGNQGKKTVCLVTGGNVELSTLCKLKGAGKWK